MNQPDVLDTPHHSQVVGLGLAAPSITTQNTQYQDVPLPRGNYNIFGAESGKKKIISTARPSMKGQQLGNDRYETNDDQQTHSPQLQPGLNYNSQSIISETLEMNQSQHVKNQNE